MARVVQVSDSHLSATAPEANSNWRVVVHHINTNPPDLVVHTGDIALDGANSGADLVHARAQLDHLAVPWLAIPGNHDMGDFGDTPEPVTQARRSRYEDVFGATSWSYALDGWQLVGVDVQTLLSDGDPAAAGELWDWLTEQLSGSSPIALFIHRPLRPWADAEVDSSHRYVTEPSRQRLLTMVEDADVRLVASGHIHQWRDINDGCRHVWAPSTWGVIPEEVQPTIGTKVLGLVAHELGAEGQVTSELIVPHDMVQQTIGEDFPLPYGH